MSHESLLNLCANKNHKKTSFYFIRVQARNLRLKHNHAYVRQLQGGLLLHSAWSRVFIFA